MSSLTSTVNFETIQENKVLLGCNCFRVIIAFILRFFTENENEAPLPRHDWTLLVICGIIVHKFMISPLCCWLNWFWKWKSLHLPHCTLLLNHRSINIEFELSHPETLLQSHLLVKLSGVSSRYLPQSAVYLGMIWSNIYCSFYTTAKSYHRSSGDDTFETRKEELLYITKPKCSVSK